MVLFVRSRHGELTKSVFLVILLLWPHDKLQKRVWWHTKMFKSKQQSKRNKSVSVGGCCRGQNMLFFLFAQSRAVLQQHFKPVLFGVWGGGLKVGSVSDGFCCCWICPQDKPLTYCCAVKSDKKLINWSQNVFIWYEESNIEEATLLSFASRCCITDCCMGNVWKWHYLTHPRRLGCIL